MPTWISVSIWTIWALWLLVEVSSMHAVISHNSNSTLVRLKGKISYTKSSTRWMVAFVVLTAFWVSWNIFG